jgi:DNA-binding NarL/FixJ family response regulator
LIAMRRILICDDHPLVRQALATTVKGLWPDAEVLEARDFPSGWALAERSPDLILADLSMPGAEPRKGIAELRRRAPGAVCLVVTGSAEEPLLSELAGDGVAGFVHKTSTPAVIEAAVAMVANGGRFLPPRLAGATARPAEPGNAGRASISLSERQREVLRLMAEGCSNKAIAQRLAISPETVKTHVSQVYAALGAINRADACVRGKSLGLI